MKLALSKRKPVLVLDDDKESSIAKNLFLSEQIDFVEYHIRKFDESCCGELPNVSAPSIFAPEGLFKGLEGVYSFLALKKGRSDRIPESESAYW